jgi:hypothetical protein
LQELSAKQQTLIPMMRMGLTLSIMDMFDLRSHGVDGVR